MYSTPTVSAASSSPAKTNDFMLSPRKFGPGQDRGSSRDGGYAEVSYRVLNRPTNGAAVQANTHSRLAAEPSQSPQRYWQVEPLTGENPRKEQTTAQDSVVATSGSARESLRGLAAERDRLQRQVQEMRTDVSNARQDLSTQHARQKVQTDELRTTLQDLQADTERLQTEQRRQATALKNSLKVGDSSRLEKQVEGVASIVKSQEQRFDRLENDIGSAYESQRLQLQQALAENRQLAKGLEEDSQRRANMMMELVEKATRTGNASQLSAELANATNAIQGQTSDWSVLSRQIHSDVSGLSLEMKADCDARAVEASTRRMEVLKMMEDARRQGALEALGICEAGLSESHVLNGAQDMLSRPGFVAVQHLVDLNCKILRDMESQLIIRAGFLANIFHFWRCEDCYPYSWWRLEALPDWAGGELFCLGALPWKYTEYPSLYCGPCNVNRDASVKPTDAVIFLYVHRESSTFRHAIEAAASSWKYCCSPGVLQGPFDFRCEVCHVSTRTAADFAAHNAGKMHRKRVALEEHWEAALNDSRGRLMEVTCNLHGEGKDHKGDDRSSVTSVLPRGQPLTPAAWEAFREREEQLLQHLKEDRENQLDEFRTEAEKLHAAALAAMVSVEPAAARSLPGGSQADSRSRFREDGEATAPLRSAPDRLEAPSGFQPGWTNPFGLDPAKEVFDPFGVPAYDYRTLLANAQLRTQMHGKPFEHPDFWNVRGSKASNVMHF